MIHAYFPFCSLTYWQIKVTLNKIIADFIFKEVRFVNPHSILLASHIFVAGSYCLWWSKEQEHLFNSCQSLGLENGHLGVFCREFAYRSQSPSDMSAHLTDFWLANLQVSHAVLNLIGWPVGQSYCISWSSGFILK